MTTFPDDDDGDVLRSLQRQGVDLTQPRSIDFYCWVRDRSTAEQIAAILDARGFTSDVEEPESADQRLSVYAAIWMVPDYGELVRIQEELNALLIKFGTCCDGWGTLVDPRDSPSAQP